MDIIALSAFSDNYIWVLREGDRVAVVDPGDAAPVIDYLQKTNTSLCAILVTHFHADHTTGIPALLAHAKVPVYGPAREAERINTISHPVAAGDRVKLAELGVEFAVIDSGGHTLGHIAYYGANALFCGDTLFSGGCGRIFEGTPQQMWESLQRLAQLPPATKVYCAHEYTQSNLRFALAVEPGNPALLARAKEVEELRAADKMTLPSTIAAELEINPFLRWASPEVIASAQKTVGLPVTDPVEVFAAIRQWKNVF